MSFIIFLYTSFDLLSFLFLLYHSFFSFSSTTLRKIVFWARITEHIEIHCVSSLSISILVSQQHYSHALRSDTKRQTQTPPWPSMQRTPILLAACFALEAHSPLFATPFNLAQSLSTFFRQPPLNPLHLPSMRCFRSFAFPFVCFLFADCLIFTCVVLPVIPIIVLCLKSVFFF